MNSCLLNGIGLGLASLHHVAVTPNIRGLVEYVRPTSTIVAISAGLPTSLIALQQSVSLALAATFRGSYQCQLKIPRRS